MRTSKTWMMVAGAAIAGAGLIGWRASENANRANGPIAVVDIVEIFDEMLAKPEHRDPLAELQASFETEFDEMQQAFVDLQLQLQQVQQSDPQYTMLITQAQQLQQRIQMFQREKGQEYERAAGERSAIVYREIAGAARAVASREGYDYLICSRTSGIDDADAVHPSVVVQQILSTPVLSMREGTDLTATVRAELGLPDPSAAAETPADAGMDAGSDG